MQLKLDWLFRKILYKNTLSCFNVIFLYLNQNGPRGKCSYNVINSMDYLLIVLLSGHVLEGKLQMYGRKRESSGDSMRKCKEMNKEYGRREG
jgi:hypothetical protein